MIGFLEYLVRLIEDTLRVFLNVRYFARLGTAMYVPPGHAPFQHVEAMA